MYIQEDSLLIELQSIIVPNSKHAEMLHFRFIILNRLNIETRGTL